MRLSRLQTYNVRNLQQINLLAHPCFNLLQGANGSGKTSLLEAIYLLAVGRSFRTRQIQSVICYHETTLACYGEVIDDNQVKSTLGIEKTRAGEVKCKVGGEICARLSAFATILPVQLLTPDTFKLLTAGAEERRRLLDWGVFHVEHNFASACQRYQRLLKQRNALLKQGSNAPSLAAWERELAAVGESIDHKRVQYLADLLPFIHTLQAALLPSIPLKIEYQRGWSKECSLAEALQSTLTRDQQWGYTSKGPHRAELAITIEGFPAAQVLSRGQQKCLIFILHMAQAVHLKHVTRKQCVYLLDDLASELDEANRYKILKELASQGHQIFLTGADSRDWEILQQWQGKTFHVEQGRVDAIVELNGCLLTDS